jgi:regulator of sigma E protease
MSTPMRLVLVVVILAAVIYLLSANFEKIGAVLMVLFGFGGVIMIHEFGHFIFGKMTDTKVEAFSIGFSPVLVGMRRTEAGMHIRVLPTLVPRDRGEPGQGALDFTFGNPGKVWDTEYRIGLIPFGGFVALMGQEDVGVAERTNDPRSFTNKSLLARIAIIMAGVTFNAISALVIFMIIFHNGIRLQAPVIGDVMASSPADKAGLKAGDEVVSIEGDTFIDYMNIALAGALSGKDEPVNMVIKHTEPDGKTKTFPVSIVPRSGKGTGVMKFVRAFGVGRAHSLEIGKLATDEDRKQLFETTGLMEKDVVVAVNSHSVKDSAEFNELIGRSLIPSVTMAVERIDKKAGSTSNVKVEVPLEIPAVQPDFEKRSTATGILGIVPRLRFAGDASDAKFIVMARHTTPGSKPPVYDPNFIRNEKSLLPGDIILKVGQCEYPTFATLRAAMDQYEKTKVAHSKDPAVAFASEQLVTVLRAVDGKDEMISFNVEPKPSPALDGAYIIGIAPALDMRHTAVAQVIDYTGGPGAGSIPAGAMIATVAGQKVSSFYDIVSALRNSAGKNITIEWQKDAAKGSVKLDVPQSDEGITIRSELAVGVPFDDLRRLYKADNPAQAIVMGWKRTELFIKQAVVTIEKLISGALSPRTLSGPVGIVTATFKVAESGEYSFYFYWLALISASIAVMNLLPLPILDGGLIVLMIIEKIKGSPISQRMQAAINYAGLALLAALMICATFNDIVMFFK